MTPTPPQPTPRSRVTLPRFRVNLAVVREVVSVLLLLVGVALVVFAGFIVHPAAGFALLGGWCILLGWMMGTVNSG